MGEIRIKLSRLLGDKRITQKELSDLTKIRAATINELYNDKAKTISIKNLKKLCEALDCQPADLLVYEKD